ncbi:MAG: hypothetical protein AB7G13_10190 [Lautropia sp.]
MQTSESRLFTARGEFHACIDELLVRTRLLLATYDHDFSDWPLESRRCFDALTQLLGRPGAGWRLIVRDPDWLERHGARFGQLRRLHADRIQCRCAPPAVAPAAGIALGDRNQLLRRADLTAFRGRALFAAEPAEIDPWRLRFEALWDESTPCLVATPLGL